MKTEEDNEAAASRGPRRPGRAVSAGRPEQPGQADPLRGCVWPPARVGPRLHPRQLAPGAGRPLGHGVPASGHGGQASPAGTSCRAWCSCWWRSSWDRRGSGSSRTTFQELANQRLVHRLRCDLFHHLAVSAGALLRSRAQPASSPPASTSDIDSVEGFLPTLVDDVVTDAVLLLGTLYFLFRVQPRLTLYVAPRFLVLAFAAHPLQAAGQAIRPPGPRHDRRPGRDGQRDAGGGEGGEGVPGRGL